MSSRQFLTDEQWAVLAPLIPAPKRRIDGRGRPIEHDDRAVMDGVLWILRTGTAWADLPDRYPSYATCFRRFSRWVKDGTLRRLLEAWCQPRMVSRNINELLRYKFHKQNNLPEHHALYDAQANRYAFRERPPIST